MGPLRLLDRFEVGRSRRPCGREERCIETITFRGAEGGVIGLPEHLQELRPPWFGGEGHPFHRGVQRKLGRHLP